MRAGTGRGEGTRQRDNHYLPAFEYVVGADILPAERIVTADAFIADTGFKDDIGYVDSHF